MKPVDKSKIPFEEYLSGKIEIDYNDSVVKLLEYIYKQGKIASFDEENIEGLYVFLNPAAKNYDSFQNIEALKFLVFLEREKIITNLYLPLFIEERKEPNGNKMIILWFSPTLIDNPESFIYLSLKTEKSLRPRVIHFKVVDWQKLSDIKNSINGKHQKENTAQEIKDEISFNSDKSLLFIKGNKIKIQKFSDQYHLLRIIFEDKKELSREWFFSEVAERCDSLKRMPDKKFYNAIYQLNQKIAIETGIKDFFITTNQTFQIDSKHIKNS